MYRTLPDQLYSCKQVREIDRLAMEEAHIPGIKLMKRAAKAAFSLMLEKWPAPNAVLVFCGGGNNGGDGYIVAGLAAQRKIPARVYPLVDPSKLTGDARRAYEFAREQGVVLADMSSFDAVEPEDLIVDAILGTGFSGDMRYPEVIARINQCQCPVISLDLPSGLDGDSGHAGNVAISADLTVSFVGLKRGLLTGRGPALRGELCFSSLDIPQALYDKVPSAVSLISFTQGLPPREKDAHKGKFGHVLVVGGDSGMGGAALLAAEAALRSGAGKVSLATKPEHVAPALARLPEVMVNGVSAGNGLQTLIGKADVLVLGPGLGQSAWSEQMLYFALRSGLPLVVDADALNMLAKNTPADISSTNWIITPHPGEAARLLDCDLASIQSDRFAAARALQNKFEISVVVLKGSGSLVAHAETIHVANAGNPGMAVAGMGDVLSGVIGALLAQGLSREDASLMGVYAHAVAGDRAVDAAGEHGMLASDVITHVRSVLNGGASQEYV